MTISSFHRALKSAALLVLMCTIAVISATPVSAQWTPFARLPGAERVSAVESPAGSAGRVSDVRWDIANGRVWFQYAGKWKSLELSGAAPRAVTEGGDPPAAIARAQAYRAPKGGRAKQATRVPSPDGAWTAEYKDFNVILQPEGAPTDRAVIHATTAGTEKHWFGSADWVYGEELDQNSAMWWSPNSKLLAYYDFDESPVKDYVLLGGLTSTRTRAMAAGYPKPGDQNPIAKLEIYNLETSARTPIDVGSDREQYVYGVEWSPKGDTLLWFRSNRRQDTLELMATDPATGVSRVVITEKQATWQKNSPTLQFLADGSRFIWESESNGFSNWELWDLSKGKLLRLTDDPWVSESIVTIDEPSGWMYYSARSSKTAINSQLHRVQLDGSRRERLTNEDLHYSSFLVAPDNSHFVATKQFVDVAPSAALYAMNGEQVAALTKPAADPYGKSGVPKPEFLRITAADGETELYGLLYKPSDFDPARSYPLVIDAYGGPLISTIAPRFGSYEAQTEFGVLVAKLDNRGTPGRGKKFEGATYMKLGGADVDDQAQLVKELSKRSYVDSKRVAIMGHSYGGYMALMAVLRYPLLFQVAVAGAPPTDWRQYDTIYTERSMRTPQENPEGYDAGSAVKLAAGLKGRVLLLHGMVDDNVHPSNTFAIAQVWQQASIPFEMMLFPNSDHGIGSPAYESTKWSFILRNFGMWSQAPLGVDAAASGPAAAATVPDAGHTAKPMKPG
jgi:dipeptidyl-peptidase-4